MVVVVTIMHLVEMAEDRRDMRNRGILHCLLLSLSVHRSMQYLSQYGKCALMEWRRLEKAVEEMLGG